MKIIHESDLPKDAIHTVKAECKFYPDKTVILILECMGCNQKDEHLLENEDGMVEMIQNFEVEHAHHSTKRVN